MEARKFSAFPKMSNAAAKLSDKEQDMLYAAWWRYAAFGEVVTFENMYLQIIFEAFLEDLDNSVKSSNTNGGGRKKTGGYETQETPGSETLETGGLKDSETPRSASSETPSYINQTNPNQSKPNQTKEREGAKRKHFTPPTPAEVDAFAKTLDYCQPGFDSQRFCDYYAAQGWKLANGNTMKDWKAAVRNWIKRDIPQKTEKEEKLDAVYAEYGAVYDANTVYFDEL